VMALYRKINVTRTTTVLHSPNIRYYILEGQECSCLNDTQNFAFAGILMKPNVHSSFLLCKEVY